VDIQIIPNGVDCTELDPGEIQPGSPPEIVFAGRFMTQKNPVQVVRTLAGLRNLPWHCTMFGDGPLRGEVEKEVADQDLQHRFTLPGWVAPEEVLDCFRRADILFMPSRTEGLPLVGVQALALGLAVVAGRAGGFIDLVEPGINGFLFDPLHPEQAEPELRRLLTDPEVLLAQRIASRQMAGRFDLDRVVGQYEDCFQRAAGSRK
jgi:glycosyltransferase involved in cell wall biosynthesis